MFAVTVFVSLVGEPMESSIVVNGANVMITAVHILIKNDVEVCGYNKEILGWGKE